MTQEVSTEVLEQMGVMSKKSTFKLLKVDNGDDKSGTNATGEWVNKTKDEKGDFVREKFGKSIEGTVLIIRAKVTSKFSNNKNSVGWYSNEFNPAQQGEIITVYQMGTERKILFQGTYKELKEKFTIDDGMGNVTKNYVYKTYLYIEIKDEVMKIELSGKSQGKWFEFNLSPLSATTICEIDEEDGTYFATFKAGKKINAVKSMKTMSELFKTLQRPTPAIQAPQKNELPDGLAKEGEASDNEIPIISVEDEVKIEDIPF